MKLAKAIIVVCLIYLMVPMSSGAQEERADPELKLYWSLHGIFTNHLAGIDAKHGVQNQGVAVQYLKTLDQLALAYQNKGDFKGVMAVRAECDFVKQNFEIPGPDASDEPTELRDLKSATRALPVNLAAQRAQKVAALANAYLIRLATLQTTLTKQGNVEAAIFVQKEIDSITALCQTLDASAGDASDLPASAPAENTAAGRISPSPEVSARQSAPETRQEIADVGGMSPANMQATLITAISDDLQQGKNAWANKKPLMALCCLRNAQGLSLIIPHDSSSDNRSKAIYDRAAMIETSLQDTPLIMQCAECAGTGKVQVELRSLAGTQPTKDGFLGVKTCPACKGKKIISKIMDAATREAQEQEAEQAYSAAQVPGRVRIGLTWVPASIATHLRPRLRVILIQFRMPNVCVKCNGKKKTPCYRCNGKGWHPCGQCTDGIQEKTVYSNGRAHTKKEKCPACSGTMRIPCTTCETTGLSSSDCFSCGGSGQQTTCSNCKGTGLKACTCGGRRGSCPNCLGDGEMLCDRCSGTGGTSRY